MIRVLSISWRAAAAVAFMTFAGQALAAGDAPADPNGAYAKSMWQFVNKASAPYTGWKASSVSVDVGPPIESTAKTYVNSTAAADLKALPVGSVIVTEHVFEDKEKKTKGVAGITVRYRPAAGYDARNKDWYWAYFLPGGTYVDSSLERNPLAKAGFVTMIQDGRLWIFRTGSKDLADFKKHGELAKHVVQPGAGPLGMTVKSPDAETIRDYMVCRSGFVTKIVDDRLWVFRSGSKELAEYAKNGELAKHVVRPGAGPGGMTIKAPDAETIDAYQNAKTNFVTIVEDGRLWVFRDGSKDLADYTKHGELAKHVVRPGIGPGGMTVKSPDNETIAAYMAARDGFKTVVKDDRVWVFRAGSKELADFLKKGEPAQHISRPGAGPLGMTIKAPDAETADAYMKAQG